jgi:hypothetical protein
MVGSSPFREAFEELSNRGRHNYNLAICLNPFPEYDYINVYFLRLSKMLSLFILFCDKGINVVDKSFFDKSPRHSAREINSLFTAILLMLPPSVDIGDFPVQK